MTLFFHTNRFDTDTKVEEGCFLGEDVAHWLAESLTRWDTGVFEEDWGWAVTATRDDYKYLFGVYDHDLDETNDHGPRWCIRIYNERDKSTPWYKKLIRHVPPVAHDEVVAEIQSLIDGQADFSDSAQEPLT